MRILVFVVYCFLFNRVEASTIINVADYGVKADSFEDATTGVKKAIEACRNKEEVTLLFPKGRYDFWPQDAEIRNYYISNTSSESECPSKLKKIGLLFEKLQHITIEGSGSQFIFHGKMITFAFDHCDDMQLQHVEIDFERPTMSEMTFVSVTDSLIVADIHPDSKYAILHNKLVWYGEGWTNRNFHAILVKPRTGEMLYSSWEPFLQATAGKTDQNKVAFSGKFAKNNYQPGDVLTIRDPIRDHSGAFINQSKNISLKNVQLHYMHGLGIVSQFSENLHYDSIFVQPSSGRQISAFADAMHFSGCRGNILLENCDFKGLHDDPVNVHGTHLQVTAIVSPMVLTVKFMHDQTYGFEAFFAGDSVGFVHSAALQTYGYGTVKAARLLSEREMQVEFTDPVPRTLQKGDCLENITWTPAVTIRNCRFEGTNTRGLLVTTRKKVLIEKNTFYRTGMHAILIADDASGWYESGPATDITIRNNTFRECGYNSAPDNYVINIAPENHTLIKDYYVHRNIYIENNLFEIYDSPLLSARSTKGLYFTGNSITQTTGFIRPSTASKPAFNLTACNTVIISKNKFTGIRPTLQINTMRKKDIKSDIGNIVIKR